MKPGWVLTAALMALQAAGCRRSAPAAPDVAARIGDTEIRYSEFQGYLSRTVGDPDTVLPSDVLSQLFDQFLEERLLLRLAAERGLMAPEAGRRPAPRGRPARAARQAIDALLGEGLPRQEPEGREVAAYYQAHRADFARGERVRLRQILTEDRAAAERARREILSGADFAVVARQLSQGGGTAGRSQPRNPVGGAQGSQPSNPRAYEGELSRRDLPPAFAEVIFALKPGEVSRVVPADYGFHLFQVTRHLPPEVVPLEQARGEIAARLRREHADRLLAALVRQAQARYNVVAYERNLPFNYEGPYGDSHRTKAVPAPPR